MRRQGVALLTALLLVFLLALLAGLVGYLITQNLKDSQNAVGLSQSLAAAQGGRNVGGHLLQSSVSSTISQQINQLSLEGVLGHEGEWIMDPGDPNTQAPNQQEVAQNLSTLAQDVQNALPQGGCYGPYPLGNLPVSGGQPSTTLIRISFTGSFPACAGHPALNTNLGPGRFISGGYTSQQTYALPFAMIVYGNSGSSERSFLITGQLNLVLSNGAFSYYAYFTNQEQGFQNIIGSLNYYTGSYIFDGPVHTNGNFAFYGNTYNPNIPGTGQPWFGGPVSSSGVTDAQQPGAWFLSSNGSSQVFLTPSQLNPPAYGGTAPQFTQGVDWKAPDVPLPQNSNNQQLAAQTSGLYIPNGVGSLELFAGGPNGNPLVPNSNGGWQTQSGGPEYQYIQTCSTALPPSCTTYRYQQIGTQANGSPLYGPLYKQVGGSWVVADNASGSPIQNFSGIVYVNGNIHHLFGPPRTNPSNPSTAPPAIASFAQLDVVSADDTRITGDLTYQDPVCSGTLQRNPTTGTPEVPSCSTQPTNVLGVYAAGTGQSQAICQFPYSSQLPENGGSICIGAGNVNPLDNAPANLVLNGSFMATQTFDVENWNTAPYMGQLTVVGGVITNYDGVYGVFNSSTGQLTNGYATSFTYDPRFANGVAPPFFPTTTLPTLVGSATPVFYGSQEQVIR
jgi:hypothetical protein